MRAPIVLEHPLIQDKLSLLRDKNTGVKEFRELISEISMLMYYEATRNLPLKEIEVETPLATAKTHVIAGKKIAVIPILRSGLGMVDGIIEIMPTVKIGHIGLYRDPTTLSPVEYYCKMPADIAERDALLLEPALATGGCACAAIDILKNHTQRSIRLVCIIASPEGIARVQARHPEVDIYCAAIDQGLDRDSHVTPGFGDVGDRIYGTK